MKLGEFLIYERDGSVQLNRAKFVRSEKFKAALARGTTRYDDAVANMAGARNALIAEIERLRQQRDQLLAALKAIVSNSMFEQRFDHCGVMNATALSDRDLFRKLWANARDAIEKAEGRSVPT